MCRAIYLLCILLFYHPNENSAQVSRFYIMHIKLELQEERIPRLIAESVSGNNAILAPYFDYSHVSLSDVEEIIGTTRVTVSEASKALNINLIDLNNVSFSKNLLYEIVDTGGINVHHFYSVCVRYFLKDAMNDVPKILNILNISTTEFPEAILFGTDKQMLEVLLKGSFTEQNIEKTLEVVNQNVTLGELFSFLKQVKMEEAITKIRTTESLAHVIGSLRNLFDAHKVMKLFQFLNLNSSNFYANGAFRTVLERIVDTKEELVGTQISSESVITNSESVTLLDFEFLKDFVSLWAISVEHPLVNYQLSKNKTLPSQGIATFEIVTEQSRNETYLEIPLDIKIENLINCTYITFDDTPNSVYEENVTVIIDESGNLVINKTNSTVFHIGSPLICDDDYLFGVADWEYDFSITFSSVHLQTKSYTPILIMKVFSLPHLIS